MKSKIDWIKSTLSNDECSTDEEMTAYFIKEGNMSLNEAKKWVNKRNFYLNNIVLDDGTIYKPNK